MRNATDALALDITVTGARLFGLDGPEIATWPNFDDYLHTGGERNVAGVTTP